MFGTCQGFWAIIYGFLPSECQPNLSCTSTLVPRFQGHLSSTTPIQANMPLVDIPYDGRSPTSYNAPPERTDSWTATQSREDSLSPQGFCRCDRRRYLPGSRCLKGRVLSPLPRQGVHLPGGGIGGANARNRGLGVSSFRYPSRARGERPLGGPMGLGAATPTGLAFSTSCTPSSPQATVKTPRPGSMRNLLHSRPGGSGSVSTARGHRPSGPARHGAASCHRRTRAQKGRRWLEPVAMAHLSCGLS
jgi:hypothetical protein